MKYAWTAMTAILSLALSVSSVFADATVSPGKTAAYVSKANAPVTGSFTSIVTASIAKGKKKRVLEVDLMATDITGTNPALVIQPAVNGITMEPSGYNSAVVDCVGGFVCTATGQWFLDLDAAEIANPGMFIGQPLAIELFAASNAPSSTADVSLRARLQKK
jgi:hypothetical protein